jgi:hypothetical protein
MQKALREAQSSVKQKGKKVMTNVDRLAAELFAPIPSVSSPQVPPTVDPQKPPDSVKKKAKKK